MLSFSFILNLALVVHSQDVLALHYILPENGFIREGKQECGSINCMWIPGTYLELRKALKESYRHDKLTGRTTSTIAVYNVHRYIIKNMLLYLCMNFIGPVICYISYLYYNNITTQRLLNYMVFSPPLSLSLLSFLFFHSSIFPFLLLLLIFSSSSPLLYIFSVCSWWKIAKRHVPSLCELPTNISIAESEESHARYHEKIFDIAFKYYDGKQ